MSDREGAVGPVAAASASRGSGREKTGAEETGAEETGAEETGVGQLPVLYGVVRFDSGENRRVRDTTITFGSAESAELFAIENGWHDYQVTPLFFFTDVAAMVGTGMSLDVASARAAYSQGP